jgi:uncharacterized protein with ParB-like and HNH nuclease domain
MIELSKFFYKVNLKMDNRVYYGEYSLKHWIDLVLKKNIVLPEYQRYFVWKEHKVRTLIETFKNKKFVPPVTIGVYKINGNSVNLILDGQQRITSILLAYLGLYPDAKKFKSKIEKFVPEDDNDESEEIENILEWNLNQLTQTGNTKDAILKKLEDIAYKKIHLDIDENFFETNFLGFSYLVPHTDDVKSQQKYYSSVFRNINIQGEALLAQESRESLYFLDRDLKDFFSPKFSRSFSVKILNSTKKIDFVRYLSLLSQYNNTQCIEKLASGYGSKMEKFYEEYIYSVVSGDNSYIYGKFMNIFPNKSFSTELSKLSNTINELNLSKEYTSIIDLDIYFFGLIYQIVFKKKSINNLHKKELIIDIKNVISTLKSDDTYSRNPNNLTNLRNRIKSSLEIYEKYIT